MTELLPAELSELTAPAEANKPAGTPYIRLAYEGLARVAEKGGFSRKDIPKHLNTFFPDQQISQNS